MAFLSTFVGVGKHVDPDIRDLVGAARDARAIHALFHDSITGSTPRRLVDFDATVANIRKALEESLGYATLED
jgi:helicase